MDFTKDTERITYRTGYKIGFAASYLLFFSMLWYILTKFKAIKIPYIYFVGAFLIVLLLYTMLEKPLRRVFK